MPNGVLIVFPDVWLWHSPVLNLANCLAERGIRVVLTSPPSAVSIPESSLHQNVELDSFPAFARQAKFGRVHSLARLVKQAHGAWRRLGRICGDHKICLAVDEYGSVTALLANLAPTCYVSLEFPSKRPDLGSRIVAALHSRAYSRAISIAVQDEERLQELNAILDAHSPPQVFYLPSAARRDRLVVPPGENYLREKFGIGLEFRHIILYAGSTGQIFLPRDYVRPLAELDHCAVVIHGLAASSRAAEFSEATNFFFSEEMLPYDQVDRLFQSCDIGLNFYEPEDINMTLMGKASSKMSFYLKHGKPVLTNNLPSLQRVISDYQCGVAVDEPSAVPNAVREILKNYGSYSANAERCFLDALSFDKFVEPILDWIDVTASGRSVVNN